MSAAARRFTWSVSLPASLLLLLLAPITARANNGSCGIQYPPQSRSAQGECTGGSSCPNKMCVLADWNANKNRFDGCDCEAQNNSGCEWVDPLYSGSQTVGVLAPVGSSLEVRVHSGPGGVVTETIGFGVSVEGPSYITLSRPVVPGEYISVASLLNAAASDTIPVQNVALGLPGTSPVGVSLLAVGLIGLSILLLSRKRPAVA